MAIVGVGSVGGHVAVELARAGVGELTLIDHDVLAPGNLYRHVLGARWLGQNKALALAQLIQEDRPYARVTGVPGRVQDALSAGLDLAKYDAVVIAVDRPSVALWLHARLRKDGLRVGVMAWLEALGVAAHSFRFVGGVGCVECMYTDIESGELRECAFHVAAEGQDFTMDVGGCGSPAAPFGSIDAVRAATLATRHVIEALGHGRIHTELVTWKGDLDVFREAGFSLSGRASDGGEIVKYTGVQIARSACRRCG